MIALFIITIIVLIGWFISEFKGKKVLRIILGISSIIAISYISILCVSVIPSYEKSFVVSSMEKIERYLQKDNIPIIKKAVSKYNEIINKTKDSYKASMEMYNVLSKENNK